MPGKVANRGGCQYSDYQCGDGPKTGSAKVKKLDKHRLRFTFAANAKGNGLVFFDRAPAKGFVEHKLK
ncbi:MAG: hypothetical protein QOE38_2631 [Thermoleophilaceae bacterium]|nr:hypothetical protein [Thermoleophilaceae bacterium]